MQESPKSGASLGLVSKGKVTDCRSHVAPKLEEERGCFPHRERWEHHRWHFPACWVCSGSDILVASGAAETSS